MTDFRLDLLTESSSPSPDGRGSGGWVKPKYGDFMEASPPTLTLTRQGGRDVCRSGSRKRAVGLPEEA